MTLISWQSAAPLVDGEKLEQPSRKSSEEIRTDPRKRATTQLSDSLGRERL